MRRVHDVVFFLSGVTIFVYALALAVVAQAPNAPQEQPLPGQPCDVPCVVFPNELPIPVAQGGQSDRPTPQRPTPRTPYGTPMPRTTTLNPTQIIFAASPDHAVVVGGQPVVDRYAVAYYQQPGGQSVLIESIGKPTPDGTGAVTTPISAAAKAQMTNGTIYVVTVVAIGPGGQSSGTPSNEFSFDTLGPTTPPAPAPVPSTVVR